MVAAGRIIDAEIAELLATGDILFRSGGERGFSGFVEDNNFQFKFREADNQFALT